MKYSAILFDLDGVICHTDKYHYKAWKSIADELGLPFDETTNNRLRGVSRRESLDIILEAHPVALGEAEKNALAQRKNQRYVQLLQGMGPQDLSAEVKTTLDALRKAGLRLAIGSSSKNAPMILERIGLGSYFDAVADGNGITKTKPDPEVFLLAARLLGAPAQTCLVVEDALAGVRAATAAGMDSAAIGDAARYNEATVRLAGFSQLLDVVL